MEIPPLDTIHNILSGETPVQFSPLNSRRTKKGRESNEDKK
jgi:hypothetical protein